MNWEGLVKYVQQLPLPIMMYNYYDNTRDLRVSMCHNIYITIRWWYYMIYMSDVFFPWLPRHSISSARRLVGWLHFAVRHGLQDRRQDVSGRGTGESQRETQVEKSEYKRLPVISLYIPAGDSFFRRTLMWCWHPQINFGFERWRGGCTYFGIVVTNVYELYNN